MKMTRELFIIGGIITIGAVTLTILTNSRERATPTNYPEVAIPIQVESGEDPTLNSSGQTGGSLQQPGSFTGQDSGAADLQGAASFSPDELNSLNF